MLSHADCNTLDQFAESAGLLMHRSRERGYHGGSACLVFNHNQGYRRIRRHCAFRALVPLVSLGDTIAIDGEDAFVDEGDVVCLEMWRLLFGEGGAVPGYCCLSRAVVVILYKVLALANGAYIDNFGAM